MSFQQLIPFVPLLFVALIPSTSATTFNFTSFAPTSLSAIKFSGDAFLSSEGVIELTRNRAYREEVRSSHGHAIYANPVTLYYLASATAPVADFTTHFTFAFNGLSNSSNANKLAFYLAPTSGGIGLPSNQTVAIEFDHMGFRVDSNSSVATKGRSSQCSPAHTGNEPNCLTMPKGFNGELKGEAKVGYNSTNLTLFATLIYQNELDPLTLFLQINLTKVLPEHVTVGFSASTHQSKVMHTISKWEFRSHVLNPAPAPSPASTGNVGSLSTNTKHNNRRIAALVACLVVLILIGAASLFLIIIRKILKSKEKNEEEEDRDPENYSAQDDAYSHTTVGMSIDFSTGPRRYSYAQLSEATDNFSQEGKLGQGGFGLVYHGTLADTLEEVAVKRFSKGSRQGKKEYVAEVTVISRLSHRNLVRLIGWCHEQGELLLVYEYMPKGSLDLHLFGRRVMTWAQRMRVARGLASAVLYLHEECEQCVLHRDIKSSNVMIDSEFNARLGDFGLARLVDHGQDGQTTKVAGTMGYLAPECVITGKASKECDVYSFGIVLLELATGLRASRTVGELEEWLVEWVWKKFGEGALLEGVDKRLGLEYERNEAECMMMVGLWCLHPDPDRRPTIRDAILVLSFQAELPRVPTKMPVLAFYEPPLCGPEAGLTMTSCSRRTMIRTTTTAESATPQSLLESHKDPQREAWSYII